jgi:hypothetical protein
LKPDELAKKLAINLKEKPRFFSELLNEYSRIDYRSFLLGWSELRTKYELQRDGQGRYLIKI